jgi:predicted metal-binding membrane protein
VPKILILLIVITLSAWGFLVYQYWQMNTLPMSEMWMPPNSPRQWQLTDFVVVYSMWAIMMAAMMLPSAVPMIKAFSKSCRQRYGGDTPFSILFSLAYLLVWLVFSVILTLLQWQLHGLQWLSGMMENSNAFLAAGILIMAGIYQFTALKNACLQHCRSPFSFLLNSWQNGRQGAFNMGLIHGSTCVGCCWAQMLIMFAVGVMNITAMVLITLFILLEKGLPANEQLFSRVTGVVLCVWGGLILL